MKNAIIKQNVYTNNIMLFLYKCNVTCHWNAFNVQICNHEMVIDYVNERTVNVQGISIDFELSKGISIDFELSKGMPRHSNLLE